MKLASAAVAMMPDKDLPHTLTKSGPTVPGTIMIKFEHGESAVLIEVSLERSSSSDVQGNAMGPAPQHFGVPQFYADYVKSLLLQ